METVSVTRLFLQTYLLFPANILFWLVMLLVAFQYRRMAHNEIRFFGRAKYTPWRLTAYSALFGLAGGMFASVLIVLFGISLMEIGIVYVWPLAVLLLLVHPRYLCFAYAGGLIGAFSAMLQLLSRFLPALVAGPLSGIAGIHIPGLLALIGILHLTESLLIATGGHMFPSPLFLKTDSGVIGGFSLQKFWPLPLVGLLAMAVPEAAAQAAVAARMPDWWPVFASRIPVEAGHTLMYVLLPVVAGLGYGDLAVSTEPRRKSRASSLNLAAYSLILIAASFLAFRWPAVTIPAALFAPLGHEFLIMMGNNKEFSGKPLYATPTAGVRVLDIFPESAAAAAGLQPGDVILSVNGIPADNYQLFHILMRDSIPPVTLAIERGGRLLAIKLWQTGEAGIVPVPDRYIPVYVEVKHHHFLALLRERLAGLIGKRQA